MGWVRLGALSFPGLVSVVVVFAVDLLVQRDFLASSAFFLLLAFAFGQS